MGMQSAAEQVVTERPDGRLGFWDAVKGYARQKRFTKTNGELSVEVVTGMIVAI